MWIVVATRHCFGCCSFLQLPLGITRKPGFTDTPFIYGSNLYVCLFPSFPPSCLLLTLSVLSLCCSVLQAAFIIKAHKPRHLVLLHRSSNSARRKSSLKPFSDLNVDVDSNWCSPLFIEEHSRTLDARWQSLFRDRGYSFAVDSSPYFLLFSISSLSSHLLLCLLCPPLCLISPPCVCCN